MTTLSSRAKPSQILKVTPLSLPNVILPLLSEQIYTENHGPGVSPGVCPQISRTLCSGFATVCLIRVIVDELKDSFELDMANT